MCKGQYQDRPVWVQPPVRAVDCTDSWSQPPSATVVQCGWNGVGDGPEHSMWKNGVLIKPGMVKPFLLGS